MVPTVFGEESRGHDLVQKWLMRRDFRTKEDCWSVKENYKIYLFLVLDAYLSFFLGNIPLLAYNISFIYCPTYWNA